MPERSKSIMDTFLVNQLRVQCETLTPIRLNEHKGSAIRGALYHALRGSPDPRHLVSR